jgi:hypothetical protein
MPQMGVSVAEGTIVEWLKQPGDPVEADETVCMVTTDKNEESKSSKISLASIPKKNKHKEEMEVPE